MNKPITENDFADMVDDLFPEPERHSNDGKYRDITEASKLFELAKRMAIDFAQTTYKDHYDNLTSAAFGMTHYPEKTTEQLFELYQQQKQ